MSNIKQRMKNYLEGVIISEEAEMAKIISHYIAFSPSEMAGPNATLTRHTIMKSKGTVELAKLLVRQLNNDKDEF